MITKAWMLNLEMFWLIASNFLPGKDLYMRGKTVKYGGILQKQNKFKKTSMFYLLVPNMEPPFPVQPLTEVQVMGSTCENINISSRMNCNSVDRGLESPVLQPGRQNRHEQRACCDPG